MFKSTYSIFFQQSRSNVGWRAAQLSQFCTEFRMVPPTLLPKEQKAVIISRETEDMSKYLTLMVQPEHSKYVIVRPLDYDKWLTKTKCQARMHLRNMFVRGIGLQDNKSDILSNGQAVFFEVLNSLRENDFSNLVPYTLGGSRTFQYHRQQLNKLDGLQKTAFDINEEDLMGENGHLMTLPYVSEELGSFIHDISYVHLDANGESVEGKDGKPVVYCRYKLVFGAIYKWQLLVNQLKSSTWNDKKSKRYPNREYKFKTPRNVIVELDICQQVQIPQSIPTKLESNRLLYDFHVFSF